jgi:major membrane immunogen (membrane-anchored lipoprotein)
MKIKKLLSIIAAGVMTLSILSGCGKATETATTEKAVETTAPAATVETTAAAPTSATYTASAKDYDERGWKAQLILTYENDKIVKVEYDEINKDGKKKSEDEGYTKAMKDAKGITPAEVYAKLTETALKEDKVETVTGATVASKEFETLFAEAKAMKK